MRTPMLLLYLALTAALAVLAVLNGADAGAARGGSTTVAEVTGYGAAGARFAAATALDLGDAARAANLARITVLRAPIERGGTSLLGLARLEAGDTVGGISAMRAALMLGWRDPLTQGWALQASIDNDDATNAALRLDALARLEPKLDNLSPAFEAVEQTEEGRAAILARMKLRPAWLDGYLQSADRATPTGVGNRTNMILAATRFADQVDPLAASSAVWAMHRRDPVAAYRLWRILNGDRIGSEVPQTVLPPIASAIETMNKTPFDWWVAEDGPLVSPSSSGTGLLLETERPGRQLALFINTRLGSDRQYRLVLDGKGPDDMLSVDARCANNPNQVTLISRIARNTTQLIVPAACPSQIITLSVTGGPASYEIRKVRLEVESLGS